MSQRTPHPKVSLVGAGPGDPDLLTLKALKALQSASVILVDDLVSDAIMGLANPGARVIWVGKRGGCRSTPQAFIHKLMVQAALDGEQGIDVDIINGITSALAGMASVQTALTHRDHAQGVVFITGHRQKEGQAAPWAELARTAHQAHLTLVIYMGLSQVAHIQAQLLLGLPAQTPVALLENISMPQQRQALTHLGELAQCVSQLGFASPTVMVVGQVVAGMKALGLSEDAAPTALKTQP